LSWTLSEVLEGKTVQVTGVISSLPEITQKRTRFEFNLETLNGLPQKNTKLLLSWYQGIETVHVGEKWQLNVRLKRPHGLFNPGGFDYEKWLFQKRIRATGYVVKQSDNLRLDTASWIYVIDTFRENLAQKLEENLKGESTTGLIVALVMGLQKGISSSQWEVMRATGTSHLMAISGMHIGFVAGFMYAIVNFIWRRYSRLLLILPAMQAAALGGFFSAIFYAAMAGFSLPTQRAVIMLFAFLLGLFLRKTLSVWCAFALALIIVLLWDPLSTFSVSFWLSFGAVFTILFGMSGRLKAEGLWWKYGRVQWVVTLALMPLCLLLFQQTSVISFFANMFAIPIIGLFVLPLSLLGALCLFMYEPVAQWLLLFAAKIIDAMWWMLTELSKIKFAVWEQNIPSIGVLFFSILGIFLLMMPKGMPSRYLGLFCFFPLFFYQEPSIKFGEVSLTLLDVGQGLATVIQTQNHALLFDAGPTMGFDDAGQRVVLPFFQNRKIQMIDKMVLSHGDNDHVGGANSILKNITVKEVLTSVPEKFEAQSARLCEKGMRWSWDGVIFEMLYPIRDQLGKGNDSSCVLRIQVGKHSILLTGDIEKSAEQYLVQHDSSSLKSDVIVAPHHGSKTSSTLMFVRAVQPRYVLYPTGYLNRYRFPNVEVFERYHAIGADAFDTGKDGAIMLIMDDKGVFNVVGYREQKRRFWHK
jgi:competence protein ComEC